MVNATLCSIFVLHFLFFPIGLKLHFMPLALRQGYLTFTLARSQIRPLDFAQSSFVPCGWRSQPHGTKDDDGWSFSSLQASLKVTIPWDKPRGIPIIKQGWEQLRAERLRVEQLT